VTESVRTFRHVVRVMDTDEEFTCGEDEFILDAMIHARTGPVRHGCCGGGCGICRMKVERGSIFAAKRMSREHISPTDLEDGIVLLCCVQPRGEVLLARV
jgi:ferredoxin